MAVPHADAPAPRDSFRANQRETRDMLLGSSVVVRGAVFRAGRDGGLDKEAFQVPHMSRRISRKRVAYGNDAIDSRIVIMPIDRWPASSIHGVAFANILELSNSLKDGERKPKLLGIVDLNRVNDALRRRFSLCGSFGCGGRLFHMLQALRKLETRRASLLQGGVGRLRSRQGARRGGDRQAPRSIAPAFQSFAFLAPFARAFVPSAPTQRSSEIHFPIPVVGITKHYATPAPLLRGCIDFDLVVRARRE